MLFQPMINNKTISRLWQGVFAARQPMIVKERAKDPRARRSLCSPSAVRSHARPTSALTTTALPRSAAAAAADDESKQVHTSNLHITPTQPHRRSNKIRATWQIRRPSVTWRSAVPDSQSGGRQREGVIGRREGVSVTIRGRGRTGTRDCATTDLSTNSEQPARHTRDSLCHRRASAATANYLDTHTGCMWLSLL